MKRRPISLLLIVALLNAVVLVPTGNAAYKVKNNLKNMPVEGTSQPMTGALSDGGEFTGMLTVLGFTQSATDPNQLEVTGVLNGRATDSTGAITPIVNEAFTAVATLVDGTDTSGISIQQEEVCDILFLDLGPIFLDLLGLVVNLSQVILDIDAVAGEGNLLGNLLCLIVNLLNPEP